MRRNPKTAYRLIWVLFSSLLFSITSPTQSGGTGTVTISGTIGYYDSATASVVPIAGMRTYLGSGTTGTNVNFLTNGSGQFTATVPAATDYSLSFTYIAQAGDPLPPTVGATLQNLDFSTSRTLNLTIPAAHKIRVKISDSDGNPLPGAKFHLNGGTTFGSGTLLEVSPFAESATQLINFSSGYGGTPVKYTADSQGWATMYTLDFPALIDGFIEYTVPAGFKIYDSFRFMPTSDLEIERTLTIPEDVTVSGTLSYLDSASTVRPLANQKITFSGGGTDRTVTTNSQGQYSAIVPADDGFSANMQWVTGGVDVATRDEDYFPNLDIEMPGQITVFLQNLLFDTDTVLNIQLPKAYKVAVTVQDQNQNPLVGAKVSIAAGSTFGSSTVPTISGYSGTSTSLINFSGGYNDEAKEYVTDSLGRVNLWSYGFSTPIQGFVSYQAQAGFSTSKNFTFLPIGDTSTVVSINLPATRTLQGRIAYTESNSAVVPVANKTIEFGSGEAASSTTATTDANGEYSVVVPEANDYSVNMSWMPSLTASLPASVSFILQGLVVDTDTVLNVTLPKARKISTTITDSAGQPVRGAKTSLGTSAYFGSSAQLIIGGYAGSLTKLFTFGTSGNGFTPFYPANDSGVATMYAFDFPNPINGLVTYRTSSGFSTSNTLTLTPTSDLNLTSQFNNFVAASSLGVNSGDLSIFSSNGTTLTDVSIAPSTANDVPDGVIDLTGVLTYRVRNLTPGQIITMTFVLPDGVSPTNIFKKIAGTLVDLSSIATFESQTVTMLIQDGGDGDDDGEANGVIVDPLTFVNASTSTSISTLSTFSINGTSVITPGSAVSLPHGTSSATVVATPTAAGASRTISGNTGLVTGANTVTVRVTAANGINMETYTATVNVAASAPAPSAPAPSAGGGGGGGGVGTTWFNLFVSNPDDSTQAYQGEACAIFVHKLKEGDKNLGPVCATKAGSLDFEANDGDFVIKTYDKAQPTFYKEYKAKVTFGTFEVVGAGYRGGSVPRRVITVLKPSEYPVVPVVTPTPTPSPTPTASPTPSVTATPSPSPKPTSSVTNGVKNGYLATTTSTKGAIKVGIKSASAKLNQPRTKALSLSLPASTSVSEISMTIKMPDGKVATILKVTSVKNKETTAPALKFAKAGVYVLTVKIGSQKRTLTITVK